MSTARLAALAVNTPEMEETWGRGGRETELRSWSSPANRARETRLLCTETCSNRPEPAHSSVGLEKCPLRRWPEGKNGTGNVHLSYGSDASIHLYVFLKCFSFFPPKKRSDIKDVYIKSDSENNYFLNVKHLNMSFCAWIRPVFLMRYKDNTCVYIHTLKATKL